VRGGVAARGGVATRGGVSAGGGGAARGGVAARLALLLVLAAAAAGCGIDRDEKVDAPGSTLDITVVDRDGDGQLERGDGEPLVDRTELAPRGRADRETARIGHLTDTHVRDEESPARVPFLDRLGPPVTSTFRPQEALSSQVLVAAIRALNAERPQGVLVSGDLVDSAQRNELRQFLDALEGGRVDPDSGREGYRGVQQASNPDGFFYRPGVDAPRLPSLLVRAQRAFVSPGLRAPWWPAVGNHDLMVQGELPPSPSTDAIATGTELLQSYDRSLETLLDDVGEVGGDPSSPDLRDVPRETIEALLADGVPGDTTTVPGDEERAHLRAGELLARLREAARLAGDGERLNYAVDVGAALRVVVLDSVDREGGAGGEITGEERAFLRRQLRSGGDRAIVVASHHGLHRARGGEAARRLLDDDDRVVAELHGDTHRHEIRPVRTSAGGYWRISTSSLADWPQQGRMLRLVTGPDGSRALETWVVDHAGGAGGEDLPGQARTLAYIDAQGGRPQRFAATRESRNARLWLPRRAG
jgi:3',5'-cyclic AMP phosphodiesterase CpdA